MDYTLVIGLLVVLVVGFFGYQWMMKRPAVPRPGKPASLPSASATASVAAATAVASASAPSQEAPSLGPRYPDIPGQTQAEALTKEPLQRREPSSQQAPVTNNGDAPAQFDQHLRHPEQLFHQPSDTPVSMQGSDLGSGRASSQSTPLGPAPGGAGQQGFSPEMAQNGGAFLGNSVFAFDGMEPTGFTSF